MIPAGESFDRGDLPLRNRAHARDARPLRLSIDQNGACTAHAFAASVLASGQIEVFAQDRKQAGLRIGIDGVRPAIDRELNRGHTELQNERASEGL